VRFVTGSVALDAPNWSPYTDRVLALRGCCGSTNRILSPNDDRAPLEVVAGPNQATDAVWSPDIERIAVAAGDTVYLMGVDGGDEQALVVSNGTIDGLDWLAIPTSIPGYARAKGASPLKVALVPAYRECTAPNRDHGPPLAFPSCSDPQQSSQLLTVGTADANGQPTRSVGFATLISVPGNPATPESEADVRLELDISDVRLRSDLSDYTGTLTVAFETRMTDKYNGCCVVGGPEAGTVQDGWLADAAQFGAACAATADPGEGARCSASTTMDAIVPGSVLEGRRATWQLGQIQVHSGGPSDPGPFAVQGVFVP
jgi:hypothetical protein